MDKNKIVGLFLALFMFIMLFPSLNQYCADIRTNATSTDLEIQVTTVLPYILIAFILCFAVLILLILFKEISRR